MKNKYENIIITLCSNLNFKIKEGMFFYEKIKTSTNNKDNCDELNYYFGAFINTIQAIKDNINEILIFKGKNKITWQEFEKKVTYFSFIKDARNAITHNGYQFINSWVNEKYYFGSNISRLSYGKIIDIEAPKKDLVSVCYIFFKDFLINLLEFINQNKTIFSLKHNIEEINLSIYNSNVIPNWVKENFILNNLPNELPSNYKKIKKTCLKLIDKL